MKQKRTWGIYRSLLMHQHRFKRSQQEHQPCQQSLLNHRVVAGWYSCERDQHWITLEVWTGSLRFPNRGFLGFNKMTHNQNGINSGNLFSPIKTHENSWSDQYKIHGYENKIIYDLMIYDLWYIISYFNSHLPLVLCSKRTLFSP